MSNPIAALLRSLPRVDIAVDEDGFPRNLPSETGTHVCWGAILEVIHEVEAAKSAEGGAP